jgi:hypothetical protein
MRTQSRGAQRVGYAIGALVNVVLAWVVNVWPGWESVGFLTSDTAEVIPLVNLSLLLGAVLNLIYIVADPPWLKALGSLATTGITVAVMVRLLAVFPFDFGDDASLWEPITEGLLILMVVVTALAFVVQTVQLLRLFILGPPDEDEPV